MQAGVAVLFHSPTAQLYVASKPTLLHTGLGVLPAGSAPHHPIGMLQPWAAGLPCGLEPTSCRAVGAPVAGACMLCILPPHGRRSAPHMWYAPDTCMFCMSACQNKVVDCTHGICI